MKKNNKIVDKGYLNFAKLVEERGLTAYKVGKALNLSSTLFSDWKSGKSKPKDDKLIKIANFFGVSFEFLRGIEETKQEILNILPADFPELGSLSQEETNLVLLYRKLPKQHQKALLSYLTSLLLEEE